MKADKEPRVLNAGQPTELSYRPPVDQLLRLDEPRRHGTKVDYAALGIGHAHVADLIRMATDEALHSAPTESPFVFAPVYAWWALAELRATEAIGPLLGLLRRIDEDDDDWVGEDLPRVLAEIGPAALEPLTEYLADPGHGEWARVAAAKAIGLIGEEHAEAYDDCVARLCLQLEKFVGQSETLNAFLISPLLDLGAVETAPFMEKAFAAGCVDELVQGDWEDVQIELGLKQRREHPRKPNMLTELGDKLRAAAAAPLDTPLDNPWSAPDETWDPPVEPLKTGRNDPCPCGSGKKFKKCCGQGPPAGTGA